MIKRRYPTKFIFFVSISVLSQEYDKYSLVISFVDKVERFLHSFFYKPTKQIVLDAGHSSQCRFCSYF